MLIYSPTCSTCLFSWYRLLITVSGVGGDFSQTLRFHWSPPTQLPILEARTGQFLLSCPHSLQLLGSFKVNQMWINIHFMLINSPDRSTCLFSWYGLLIWSVVSVVSVVTSVRPILMHDVDFQVSCLLSTEIHFMFCYHIQYSTH